MISATIHIFSIHTRLLYYINPEKVSGEIPPFSFLQFNERTILSMAIAIMYSLATYQAVTRLRKPILIWVFGILDALGVGLYYYTDIPLDFSKIYFAVYTLAVIITRAYIKPSQDIEEKIVQLKTKGISQKKIAAELNLSESKVSRTIKRTLEADQSTKRKAS